MLSPAVSSWLLLGLPGYSIGPPVSSSWLLLAPPGSSLALLGPPGSADYSDKKLPIVSHEHLKVRSPLHDTLGKWKWFSQEGAFQRSQEEQGGARRS